MSDMHRTMARILGCAVLSLVASATAQDWPQWRGPQRDAKASGFNAPATWPEQLTEKWQVTVGSGVATPALVGDKLYVFTRQDENEVIRCLDAGTGQEIWQQTYQAKPVEGAASRFPGPRSSPAVVDGKVVTVGAGNALLRRCRHGEAAVAQG